MTAPPIVISTLDDPRVALYRNVRDRDLYGRQGVFIAETEAVVKRLLSTPDRLHSLLLSPTRYEAMRSQLDMLPDSLAVYIADLDVMCDIAGFHVHRGVLAIGLRLPAEQLSLDSVMQRFEPDQPLRLLAAEGMTNVDNMGSLFRIAAAFGVDAIVLDQACCDPLYRKAVRVSMGHVLSVPYAVSRDWLTDLKRLKEQWGAPVIGAETCDESQPIWNLPRCSRAVIVLGSEGHGIESETLQLCDFIGAIPMHGAVPSVNVITAAAICLYELSRPTH